MEMMENKAIEETPAAVQPGKYLNTVSATLLALLKLAEGAAAGYIVYMTGRFLLSVFGMLQSSKVELRTVLGEFVQIPQWGTASLDAYSGYLTDTFVLPGIFWILLVIVTAAGFLLSVLEAIVLPVLRFGKKGAAVVKKIHQIQALLSEVNMGFFAFQFTVLFLSSEKMAAATGTELLPLRIFMIVFGVIWLLALFLVVCYHSDIVKAMEIVDTDLKNDTDGELSPTHLSGISFFFSLPFALAMILVLLGFIFRAQRFAAGMDDRSLIVAGGVFAAFMLKYWMVSLCNRNLKKAHRAAE